MENMNDQNKIKPVHKAKIGLYTVGLKAYWPQFEGLRERVIEYVDFIDKKISEHSEVFNYGLVDCADEGHKAGLWFKEKDVDLIFCHAGTYVSSDCVLPLHQECNAPAVILNLQPTTQINYAKTSTGEWLANCGACPVPEISNAFNRSNIPFRVISGLLGLDYTPKISVANENTAHRNEAIKAYREIEEWCRAAGAKRTLRKSRFGFLGNVFHGMLDMYSDFTMIQAQTGLHVEIIEMCDLNERMMNITDKEIQNKLDEIHQMFTISGDSKADPLARKPTEEQLLWSSKVAVAQEKLVRDYNLDSLIYYYHSVPNNPYQDLQGGFIVGHSLLTARGIACAGEGDIKTGIAMKICDILEKGGSYCEIVVADYEEGTILLGHDGPFHIKISNGKPILRGMGLYHGKQGTGVSVEAKVKQGPITMLGVTQTGEGKLRMIIAEGVSTDAEIMQVGNTQTHVRFPVDIDTFYNKWFQQAPTHHWAMSIGHNASLFEKVAKLMGCEYVIL